jgi:hypothetical protein
LGGGGGRGGGSGSGSGSGLYRVRVLGLGAGETPPRGEAGGGVRAPPRLELERDETAVPARMLARLRLCTSPFSASGTRLGLRFFLLPKESA